jgi:serine/threonine-protein kinase
LEEALNEFRESAGVGGGRTVIDVILVKEMMTPEELNFVRGAVLGREHPTRIGGFELLTKIGEGSMGVVYRARQTSMDRIVALKILSPQLARSPKYVARFMREARSAARLNHPNIVTGIDVGEDQGYYFFAMEFVEGRTVQRILDEEGRIAEKQAIAVAIEVARALVHAWDRGLVHRDIKPANIVITKSDAIKITDLGLAKYTREDDVSLTDTGTTVGTAYYISPEQARGDEIIDIRSDIYSLGVTLYHMVTGEPPYTGTPVSVMTQHVSAEVPDPKAANREISDAISDIIRMMLSKDPRERYASPNDLINDLTRVLEGKPPLLARSDAALSALSDAAQWEEEAEPQIVTHDEMRKLKSAIGWGRRPLMPLGLTILVAALAVLAIIMSLLYFMRG